MGDRNQARLDSSGERTLNPIGEKGMSWFPKAEWRTVLVAITIVSLCVLLSFSPFMPLAVLIGHLAAAMYLLVGVVLSLRSANELAMPPLQFAGRILHAQVFYAIVVISSLISNP